MQDPINTPEPQRRKGKYSREDRFLWTEARIALLRELVDKGFTSSQISVALEGPSRESVCGKCNRLGIRLGRKGRPRQEPDAATREPEPPVETIADIVKRLAAKAAPAPVQVVPPPPITPARRPTLFTITRSQCCWPLWADRGPKPTIDTAFVCAAPVQRVKVRGEEVLRRYCAEHGARSRPKTAAAPVTAPADKAKRAAGGARVFGRAEAGL